MTANYAASAPSAAQLPAWLRASGPQRQVRARCKRPRSAASYEERWAIGGFASRGAFNDLDHQPRANDTAAEFVRSKIRAIVKDPEVAELLCPRDYPIGTKRLCVDTDYFETFNRDNVKLVDIADAPIEEITPKGLRTGTDEYEFDAIVFATGFDAMTGALNAHRHPGPRPADAARQVGGRPAHLPRPAGGRLPNLFTITGPGSPSVLSNMIVSIEQHVDWITDCLEYLKSRRHGATIEASRRPRTLGRPRQRGRRPTLYPQATPGTWAPTSPASRASSCPISADSRSFKTACHSSPLPKLTPLRIELIDDSLS
jgi:cyclohexanone monooxygenase